MDSREDYARDRDGNILKDRFGRPVRRRPAGQPGGGGAAGGRSSGGASQQPAPPKYVRSDAPPHRGANQHGQQSQHGQYQQQAQRGQQHQYRQQAQPGQYRPYPQQSHQAQQRQQYPPQQGYPQQGYQQRGYPPQQPPNYPAGGSGHGADWGGPGRPGQRRPQYVSPGKGRRRAKRPRRRMGLRRIISLLLLTILVLGGGTMIWADTQLQRTDALQNYEGRIGRTSGTNWLLVGSDSRAGLDRETADRLSAGELDDSDGRTDSIILVHIPLVGKARMVSLPRDSFVNIPGYGENKINAAFALGGPALLQQTVEEATGLRIDHYAEVGFAGFANAVDGVGGVKMCLDEPLNDPMAGINLPAGCQNLDGPDALGFVRSRYASAGGDLDRADRQRQLLAALSKKMISPATLLNPFRLFPTISGVASSLTVDNKDHMWHLARLGLAVRGAQQDVVPTAGSVNNYAGSVLLWDELAAEELFRQLR